MKKVFNKYLVIGEEDEKIEKILKNIFVQKNSQPQRVTLKSINQRHIARVYNKCTCKSCNLVFLLPFHDSKGYDMHFIFQEIGQFDVDVNEIPVSNTYHLPQAVN